MSATGRRWRDVGLMDAIFWDLSRTVSLGRVLELRCGAGEFVRRLLEHGVDAFGVDTDAGAIAQAERDVPGRCQVAAPGRLPFDDGAFETVVCLRAPDPASGEDVSRWIRDIRRVAARHVYVRVVSGPPREWWDARFIEAGFRRHPALLSVVDYAGIEHETEAALLFERIPDDVLAACPIEALAAERDLHMDMLREAGRRSDAHLQRYAFAATLVRPNDVVLDVACGLGYGLATVAATGRAARLIGVDDSAPAIRYATRMYGDVAAEVEFRTGDAHDLAGVRDHSVDLVISFETIEHLADPRAFLGSVVRVLKPGGRFVGSVPNEWLDETGRDPNPHHLHVFDATRFLALFDTPFLVEGVFAETAGGGMKVLPDPVRGFRRLDRSGTGAASAEWWIVVAMVDPRSGAGVPYVETVHAARPGGFRPTALSFPDAYRNPWLRHAMVSLGTRFTDPAGLEALALSVEREEAAGSVDRAAALCVQGHQLLTQAQADGVAARDLLARVHWWLQSAGDSPHHLRWRISLESLAGRLALYAGARAEALGWFERCAGRNAVAFSPLLATKTVDAAYLAGAMHAWDGRDDLARHWWSTGLSQAGGACRADWREVAGDPAQPVTFGVRELGEVLDAAARCAAGLAALPVMRRAPGRLADLRVGACRADEHRVHELQAARTRRAAEARAADGPISSSPAAADEVESLRYRLDDAEARLARLRGIVAGRPAGRALHSTGEGKAMQRIVICGAGAAGRRLWERLAARPSLEIVAVVDPDPRQQARDFLGLPVHPLDWLTRGTWDYLAIPSDLVDAWQPQLVAGGADPLRVIALPADEDDPLLDAVVATLFPDPLADALAAASAPDGVRAGIFGTGAGGMKVWEVLVELDGVDAVWFADNNVARQGQRLLDLDVIAPADIPARGADIVIVGSMSRDAIGRQLRDLGLPASAIVMPDVTASIARLGEEIAGLLAGGAGRRTAGRSAGRVVPLDEARAVGRRAPARPRRPAPHLT